ncbi:unnamed protein product [Pleuronectes platessa]|uniref:Uncharacterized protein n=1 Tax=Pleuronectes platessa TaxID=8262 RepID=A0A9N7VA09_PLEPL|nr:unnamed protein product [Pleuronectes platessa]
MAPPTTVISCPQPLDTGRGPGILCELVGQSSSALIPMVTQCTNYNFPRKLHALRCTLAASVSPNTNQSALKASECESETSVTSPQSQITSVCVFMMIGSVSGSSPF